MRKENEKLKDKLILYELANFESAPPTHNTSGLKAGQTMKSSNIYNAQTMNSNNYERTMAGESRINTTQNFSNNQFTQRLG